MRTMWCHCDPTHPVGAKQMLIPQTSVRGSKPTSEGFLINWPEGLLARSISTWEDLTTRFLAQFFPSGRNAKLLPYHGIDRWLQIQIFYDHVSFHLKCEIDRAVGGKLRDKNADESWEIIENLAFTTMRAGMTQKTSSTVQDAEMPLNKVEKENEAKNGTKNEPIKSAEKELIQVDEEESVEPPSLSPGRFETHKLPSRPWIFDVIVCLLPTKRTYEESPAETDIRLSLASHSCIYPLGIAEDVLVDVAGDDKFDKGTITLRSGKSEMSFHKILESLCKIEKEIKNNIKPIAPTMIVNKLVLEWEERIKLHQEKEMEFDQWRSKTFKNKHPALVK
ncbi:hypothetical protein Tco_0965690 [Tanacetum coccineum]